MGIQSESVAQQDAHAATASLGQQLRVGRERLGLSIPEAAAKLKLSDRIIQRIEADDLADLTDGVFLRGYLLSYTRLVGLPASAIDAVISQHTQAVPLVVTGTIPRSRYLLDRWSVSATYLILTGLIVGPTVWLAMTHGGIEHNLVRTAPLDRAGENSVAINSAADSTVSVPLPAPIQSSAIETDGSTETAPTENAAPVIASLAPFSSMSTPEAGPAAPAGQHTLRLTISEPSWIEVLKPDGTRLEYGLLPVGIERTYSSDTPLSVRIGNVAGTQLHADGELVELAALKRGNVAHLRLFGEAATVARAEP